ncbi:calpain-7 [Biomphalaria pfeifferi]|uniref:Calpain-7 n=1 Tax=Biomphalaria pfeifferi TaxID=112525 RepID=A0AAD8BNB5_BIOPF|nr:calpain-7 [Biomphalaria pfeifferi]
MDYPSSGYHGADATVLQNEGTNLAQQAVQFDQIHNFEMAIFYYSEAAQTLYAAFEAGSQMPNIVNKVHEYMDRVEELKQVLKIQKTTSKYNSKDNQQLDLEKASFLLNAALDEDELNNFDEAISLYSEAIAFCLKIRDSTSDAKLKDRVVKMATQALDRAEALKKRSVKTPSSSSSVTSSNATVRTLSGKAVPPLGFGAFLDEKEDCTQKLSPSSEGPKVGTSRGRNGLINVGPSSYSKEEIAVLRSTSKINGREYVPFLAIDQKERFAYPELFNDRDGKLTLSPKQKQQFEKWARPESFCDDPKVIYAISSFSIRQTIVSDCSFVASLAISAQYEKRFRKKLITNIIYPQNRNGEPMYNPCGKYMVKLNLNGVWRKVIIDDCLPVSKYGDLLCSFSNNKNELWVSLLEKAYMKVMGGYDFPGSNSNIDLHALTEWIPERVAIRLNSPEFDKDKEFKRLLDRFHKGHCLVTVATGELSEVEADRAGLVPTHAYAMLDIKEYKGRRLFMLKNPWNHLRWKGNYSEKDTVHWTSELQKVLNYDPQSAQMFDNGVFWIDYDSLCKFFDVFYINWDPELFKYTTCMQHTWSAQEGPKRDTYNISDNPQYRLEMKGSQAGAAIWILLTRHITDKADFADNKEFITVLVYKNGGKKVFCPYDPPPYKDGVRINSPHYLCKLVEEKTSEPYTLVISQYEKNNTTHYTLRVYSTCEFSLTPIIDPYNKKYYKRLTGQWSGKSAGGCANNPATFVNNPLYQVFIDNKNVDNHLMIELLGPKQYSVGFEVICVSENVPNAVGAFKRTTSGDFRPGYCFLQMNNISGGVYNIRPCTFAAGNEGPFFLDISCSTSYTVKQLQ